MPIYSRIFDRLSDAFLVVPHFISILLQVAVFWLTSTTGLFVRLLWISSQTVEIKISYNILKLFCLADFQFFLVLIETVIQPIDNA